MLNCILSTQTPENNVLNYNHLCRGLRLLANTFTFPCKCLIKGGSGRTCFTPGPNHLFIEMCLLNPHLQIKSKASPLCLPSALDSHPSLCIKPSWPGTSLLNCFCLTSDARCPIGINTAFQIKPGSAESLIGPSSGDSGSGREVELCTSPCVFFILKSATLNYATLGATVFSDHH